MSQTFDPSKPAANQALDPDVIRNNLLAAASMFSGSSAPNTMSALVGQPWFDTVVSLLKVFRGFSFDHVVAGQPHSELAGTSNDDHVIYVLANGLRAMAGLTVTAGFKVDKIDLSELHDGKATIINQLRNGSFESFDTTELTNPPYWNAVGTPTRATDTSAVGDNGLSLRVATASANEGVAQVVRAKPSRRYTIGVWTKASSGNSAKLIIEESVDNVTYVQISSDSYSETAFTRQTREFSTAATTKFVRIKFLATNSTGSAWFDEGTLHEGDFAESYPVIEHSHDRFLEFTEYRTAGASQRNLGNVASQSGQVSFSLAAASRQTIAITFAKSFGHYLGAHVTLLTTTTNALVTSAAVGTTQGFTIEVRSASGSNVTESGTVFFTAFGVRASL
jgi:hypothetical protein